MRFIKNEQRTTTELSEPIAKWASVGFVDKQTVRNQEPRMRAPRVNAETTFL